MLELAEIGYISATDLADYMVKQLNYPFRKAYLQTAKIINYCEKNRKRLKDLKVEEINKIYNDKKNNFNNNMYCYFVFLRKKG